MYVIVNLFACHLAEKPKNLGQHSETWQHYISSSDLDRDYIAFLPFAYCFVPLRYTRGNSRVTLKISFSSVPPLFPRRKHPPEGKEESLLARLCGFLSRSFWSGFFDGTKLATLVSDDDPKGGVGGLCFFVGRATVGKGAAKGLSTVR